ncbi:hypothetical protein [Xenorhabdus bharatensis]|uniref:hypothetical protein n=1 Tax=Xenorhabdus bharatensis TaxID=3136256 RepID=UPI0030F3732C
MKFIEFSEGFHVIEDVCANNVRNDLRLNISSHGEVGVMKTPTGLIKADQLMNILKSKLNLFKYNHIRLLFCNSADGSDPFAAQFSRLLDSSRHVLVEAYTGEINIFGMEYFGDYEYENGEIRKDERRNFTFESNLNANYPIWEHVRRAQTEHKREYNISPVRNPSSVFGYTMGLEEYSTRMASYYKNAFEELGNTRMKRILKDDINPEYLYRLRKNSGKEPYERKLLTYYKNILETYCDTLEPVHEIDLLSSRIFFCNGKRVRKDDWMKEINETRYT